LAVQVLLEYIRAFQIGPLAIYLDQAYEIFVDEKDCGKLILTNIYLLAGASLPLWLTPDLSQTNSLILLSGVISIGIGDSAASIVGSKYGQIKLPGCSKTLEGTLASILSQTVFIYFCQNLSLGIILSVSLASFAEALTNQVDNIVLPLIMYLSFCIVL
jgi:dolichol kinase